MRISDYLNDRRKIDISIKLGGEEETFWVAYKPNAWTYAKWAEVKDIEGIDFLYAQAEVMLIDWDLFDDDGRKIPIDAESMKKMGVSSKLLQIILSAVNEDIAGDDESKND